MPDFNLDRFKKAQTSDYATALSKIKNGRIESLYYRTYNYSIMKLINFWIIDFSRRKTKAS